MKIYVCNSLIDILVWITLCCGCCPVHYRMFSIPDLYPLAASSTLLPAVMMKNVSRHCQMKLYQVANPWCKSWWTVSCITLRIQYCPIYQKDSTKSTLLFLCMKIKCTSQDTGSKFTQLLNIHIWIIWGQLFGNFYSDIILNLQKSCKNTTRNSCISFIIYSDSTTIHIFPN